MRCFPSVTVLCLLCACPTDPPPDDPTPDLGWDPALPVPAGESRAGVLRDGPAGEGALFGGIAAEGTGGDVQIENELVRFVIQGPSRRHGYVDTAGSVIDGDLQRPADEPGQDVIEDFFLSFGIGRLFHADDVRVVHDGTDGQPAVVEATGTDVPWAFMEGVVEAVDPLVAPLGLRIRATYTLRPGSRSLEMLSVLENPGTEPVTLTAVDGWLSAQEVLLPWVQGRGFDDVLPDLLSAAGGGGRSSAPSFALSRVDGQWDPIALSALASSAGLVGLSWGTQVVPPGGSQILDRRLTLAPDTLELDATVRLARGEALATVGGVVRDPGGSPVAGVRIHAVRAGGDPLAPEVFGFTTTGADGSWTAQVPAGSWDLYAVADGETEFIDVPEGGAQYGPFAADVNNAQILDVIRGTRPPLTGAALLGHPVPSPVNVTVESAGTAEADIVLDDAATLIVEVEDGQGGALPAVVELRYSDGHRPGGVLPGRLGLAMGLPEHDSAEAGWAWILDGRAEIPVLPGRYDVIVGAGPRRDRQSALAVEVAPGEGLSLPFALPELIPRDGWMGLDGHLHAAPSSDGELPMVDRILTCAANGLELPVATDHDREADYSPIVRALGLESVLRSIPGVEVSPVLRGHFNLYPTVPRGRATPNGGAPDWSPIPSDTEDLLARIRASGDAGALLQVNHGRGTGLMDLGGYQRNSGLPSVPDHWSWNFDLFELINGGGNGNWEEERLDFFSWLNHGHRKVPTGVSDSHGRKSDCGYGRTDIYVGTDDVALVTNQMVSEAMAAGHVVAAGGVTLRVTVEAGAETLLPGDEAKAWSTEGEVRVHARVLAPPWIVPSELRVIRNAEVVATRALPGPEVGVERLAEAIPVTVGPEDWLTVEVAGGPGLGSNWGGSTPYAMTNAFFFGPPPDSTRR
jgi:hypothetical protein